MKAKTKTNHKCGRFKLRRVLSSQGWMNGKLEGIQTEEEQAVSDGRERGRVAKEKNGIEIYRA